MPQARKRLVCSQTTPYYHCVSRCVRRAFLCGQDPQTGQDYTHRRARIEQLIFKLTQIFAIDICAYAIMSNHYHLVLHINTSQTLSWSEAEVIQRWHQCFKGNFLSQRYLNKEPLDEVQQQALQEYVQLWRTRLSDISWFMRVLNEKIAREANAEDACKGRFWEGRFKSQALLDEKALLTCMAYVDLNPVRAGIAKTPETSQYTSIYQRAKFYRHRKQPNILMPFSCASQKKQCLPFQCQEYLNLIDWSSRQLRDGKGHVNTHLPPLLQRLALNRYQWILMTKHFNTHFKGFVGCVGKLQQACQRFQLQYRSGVSMCQEMFGY